MASRAHKVSTSHAATKHTVEAAAAPAPGGGGGDPRDSVPPSLFDFFYEELLTQLMNCPQADTLPDDFMRLTTDIERVEFITALRPFVRDFEIAGKIGVKSLEKANKYREEGNKFFQQDHSTQAVLFYNKALSYAPHPDYETYLLKPEGQRQRPRPQQEHHSEDSPLSKGKKSPPSKYESLSLCYANRSAALRKLGQYEECIKDIARAAKFGYPRENLYRLWERKGKCYQGMRRPEMAVKCYRQALLSLKESTLSDNQKTLKSHEIQGWIKDLRAAHVFLQFDEPIMGLSGGSDDSSGQQPPPLMGATGPIVFVPDSLPRQRKASSMTLPPPEPTSPHPPKPERRSFRRKKTVKGDKAPPPSPLPSLNNGGGSGGDSGSLGGGSDSSLNKSNPVPLPQTPVATAPGAASQPTIASLSSSIPGGPGGGPGGELHKANSQMSISQLSATGVKPEIEVPELSYGLNPRMPSASVVLDLRFTPEKGRYFVATQDLSPGKTCALPPPASVVQRATID